MSKIDIRVEMSNIAKKANSIGGTTALENEVHFLKHWRDKATGHSELFDDYNQKIMAARWKLAACRELDKEYNSLKKKLKN